jgi:hypothetical protein
MDHKKIDEQILTILLRFENNNILLMTRLADITVKSYLMLSLILAAAFVLCFIGEEGFSAEPQGGSMSPAKSPSTTQPVIPQEPAKSQGQGNVGSVDVKTKTSSDKHGNIILSSDVSTTITIESLVRQDLEKDLKDYQIGFHKGIVDGLELAKKGGSVDDLFKKKKSSGTITIIIGTTDMTNIGYDKGLSKGYYIQKTIESIQKPTSHQNPK